MDTELDAMQKIAAALEGLEQDTRIRVLAWVAARFGITGSAPPVALPTKSGDGYADFADLFYAAGPQSHAERALVAAYWLAGETGEPFPSQTLNALLKDLGFQVANITDALTQTMRERPALVVQTKKSGNTRQARKTYKITDAGVRRVRSMIADRSSSDGGNNG